MQHLQGKPSDLHHTLMIAQDATEVFISISSYTNAYRDYLFKPTLAAALPPIADATNMLEIQEFGPFKMSTRSHFRLLAHVVLALLIKELVRLDAGVMIRSVWTETDSEDESD